MLHCDYCSTFILEFAMNDVVESILKTYQSMCPLDAERIADSRQKISRYIESLASAGQRDDEQLTIIWPGVFDRTARGARSSVHVARARFAVWCIRTMRGEGGGRSA